VKEFGLQRPCRLRKDCGIESGPLECVRSGPRVSRMQHRGPLGTRFNELSRLLRRVWKCL